MWRYVVGALVGGFLAVVIAPKEQRKRDNSVPHKPRFDASQRFEVAISRHLKTGVVVKADLSEDMANGISHGLKAYPMLLQADIDEADLALSYVRPVQE